MKHFSRVLLHATAFFAVTLAPLLAADPIEIKQHWVTGKQYFQTIETAQESSMTIAGQKMDQSMTMTIDTSASVTAPEGENKKRLAVKYDRVAVEMSMNGTEMSFDSSKPEKANDPLGIAKAMGVVGGKQLKFVLGENDKITDIENFDEFVKQLAPNAMPGVDMSKMLTKDSLTKMMSEGLLKAMPGHPVTPGESWPFNTEVELPQLGKVGIKGTYKLNGMVDHGGVQCAEIVTDGKVAMDLDGAGAATPGGAALAQLGMKVEGGTLKGTIWFDPKLGFARESQLTQEMTMTMKNPTDPSASITIPVKQNIFTKLTKVEDLK